MSTQNSARKITGIFFSLLVWACLVGNASAQLLDDILLNEDADGTVHAVIKLSSQVQYLRHTPEKSGNHLEIYFKIVGESTTDPWQGYEARTSPPSDVIPSFVVAVRDVLTEPKLVVDFKRSAEYSVRIGKNARSIVISITPDKVQSTSQNSAPGKVDIAPAIPTAPDVAVTEPELKLPAATPAKEATPAIAAAAQPSQAPIAEPTKAATSVPANKTPSVSAAVVPPTAETAVPPKVAAAPASGQETTTAIVAPQLAAETLAPGMEITPATEAALADMAKETDSQAEKLMLKARDAIKVKEFGVAIENLNKVLLLPQNKSSEEAQELIGVAREGTGQSYRAKLEYEAYLKEYPTGEGADRVKARLAKVVNTQQPAPISAKAELAKEKKIFQTTSNGSLSMNYYYGNSLTNVSGATTSSSSITDQTMLITNVNASMRSRNDRYDNRLVFSDTYNKNFLSTQTGQSTSNPNRLSTLYYDFKDNATALAARIGRQSPSGGGAMGRFDGVSGGYGITSKLQATAATGRLSDYVTGSKPVFYSLGLSISNIDKWGGSVYYVNQLTNGISDRSAVGADMRYFDASKNAYAALDYDTFFKVLNSVLIQGTLNGAMGTTYNFSLDHRKSPSISLSNALIGSPSTMSEMLQNGFNKDDLKALALLRTGTSSAATLGVNKQIKEKWATGADINVSNSSGLPESGTNIPNSLDGYVPPTPSSGNNYGINGRLIGNSVFSKNDVSVFSIGYTSSKSSKGENFSFTNHVGWAEKWTADTTLRFSLQNSYDPITSVATGKQTVFSPGLRLGYQVKNTINLDSDFGVDITDNSPSSGQSSRTTRKYFSFGGRWDF